MGKATENELVNQEAGLEICGGSREIYLQVLTLMLGYEGADGQALMDECANEDWEAFGNAAHALKSSAAGIGAAALSDMARSMEGAVDAQDYVFVRENRAAFFKLLEDTIAEIHAILGDR